MLSEVLPAPAFCGSGPTTLGRSHHLSCFHFPICQVNTGIPVYSGMWKQMLCSFSVQGQAEGQVGRFTAGKDPGHSFTSALLGWPLSLSESGQGWDARGGDTPSGSQIV